MWFKWLKWPICYWNQNVPLDRVHGCGWWLLHCQAISWHVINCRISVSRLCDKGFQLPAVEEIIESANKFNFFFQKKNPFVKGYLFLRISDRLCLLFVTHLVLLRTWMFFTAIPCLSISHYYHIFSVSGEINQNFSNKCMIINVLWLLLSLHKILVTFHGLSV